MALFSDKIKPVDKSGWRHIAALLFLYSTAHIWLLLSRAVMWDGWLWVTLLRHKQYDLLDWYFAQTRLLHIPLVYRLADTLGDPVFYSNVLQFASWFVAGLCIYLILRNFLRNHDAFLVAALYLLIPIFLVRFELTVLPYSLSNMFFFLAVFIYLQSGTLSKKFLVFGGRALSIVFFILSFFTNSFLFFYGGFLLLLLLQQISTLGVRFFSNIVRITIGWTLRHAFLILLPIIFYVLEKWLWGQPYGIYKGYNLFVFLYPGTSIARTAILLLDRTWQSVVYGLFWPILASISILQRKIFAVVFVATSISLIFLMRRCKWMKYDVNEESADMRQKLYPKCFFAGCVLFILGFIPYVLVGESANPYGHGFDMRHGLLLPLGSALIILASIRIFLSVKWQLPATAVTLSLFITFNIFNYYSVDMDSYKQRAIIESLKNKFVTKELFHDSIVVFNDKLPLYNWRGRKFEDFEYTAYLYEASGSTDTVGTVWRQSLSFDIAFMFTFRGLQEPPGDKELARRLVYADIVSPAAEVPTVTNWLQLKRADLFGDRNELTDLLKSVAVVNIIAP